MNMQIYTYIYMCVCLLYIYMCVCVCVCVSYFLNNFLFRRCICTLVERLWWSDFAKTIFLCSVD